MLASVESCFPVSRLLHETVLVNGRFLFNTPIFLFTLENLVAGVRFELTISGV